MNKEKVGKFYDVVWTEYIPEYKETENHWKLFYSSDEVKDKTVIDAGCGTGIFSIIFANNGVKKVTGIDISEGSLGTARGLKEKFNLDNAEFMKQDMLKLPFPDESFDIVWAWGTVHHTTDPFGAITELIRVLKKGGSILLAVYTRTKLTFIHEIIRKILVRTPKRSWTFLSKVMSFFLAPVVFLFKKRSVSFYYKDRDVYPCTYSPNKKNACKPRECIKGLIQKIAHHDATSHCDIHFHG